MKEIRKSGRGIRRLVTLCGLISHLVAEYDRRLLVRADRDDEDNELNNENNQLDNEDDDRRSEKKEEIKR